MIIKYNIKYRISNFEKNIYLKLIKIKWKLLYFLKKKSLFIKKIGLYKILKKINNFIYKLKLLLNISRIYLIIFIITIYKRIR